MTSCSLFCTSIHFKKGVSSKRKEFAPNGELFFPFKEGNKKKQQKLNIVVSLESVSNPFHMHSSLILEWTAFQQRHKNNFDT